MRSIRSIPIVGRVIARLQIERLDQRASRRRALPTPRRDLWRKGVLRLPARRADRDPELRLIVSIWPPSCARPAPPPKGWREFDSFPGSSAVNKPNNVISLRSLVLVWAARPPALAVSEHAGHPYPRARASGS